MMNDKSTSLEENEAAYNHACRLTKRYNLRFSTLAKRMFAMKRFAQDANMM